MRKTCLVIFLLLLVSSAYTKIFDILVLEGNISHAEFPVLKEFTKTNDQNLKFTATGDRTLPNLDRYDILWIGQGEICENDYFLDTKTEEKIKEFVQNGGIVISMGQDSDENRPCKTGWISTNPVGVERGGTKHFEVTDADIPEIANLFQNPNKVKNAYFDDAWQISSKFIALATINNGQDMGIGLLSHGSGFYIVTSLQNENADNVALNKPVMENLLNFAVNLIQSGFTDELEKIQKRVQKEARGFIVWMSNRDGDWEVFRMNIDGTEKKQLTHNSLPDRNARISPDGKLIAWTRGSERRSDVWIMDADGSNQRKVVQNASMGIWRNENELVVFRGKNNVETFLYDFKTEKEEKIWPPQDAKLKPREVRSATPSPDGKLFIGWSSKPRGTWLFSADGKFQKHIHGGCEGRFAPDGSFVYWVMNAGKFGRALLTGEILGELYKVDAKEMEYGHTYFPQLSEDMRYLVYGACPNNQHDHGSSDYEIFLMKMNSLKPTLNSPVRLTHNPRTDRWPDIFIYQDETPPTVPEQVKAKANGQKVRLSWSAATDSESDIIAYRIYRDGKKLVEIEKQTEYIDIATDRDAEYSYQISAVNSAELESKLSDIVKVKTDDSKPSKPDSLSVITGNGMVKLNWTVNPEFDIKEYRIYRADKLGDKYRRLSTVTQTSYVDSSLENGSTYYYRITAVDEKGNESNNSIPVSATPNSRVRTGLIVLYTFTEGNGKVVYDFSGVDEPLDLQIQSSEGIRWLEDKGIEFVSSSMLISDGNSNKLLKKLQSKNEISIEVWIEPANLSQSGPARIVSMSADTVQRNFTLGQIESDIAYRLRTTETSDNGIPELDTTKQILTGKRVHLVATYDGQVKYLYVNGKRHPESQKVSGDFSNWESFPLVIGNEATGDRTWLGKLFLVAVYNQTLSLEEVKQNYQAGWRTE